MMEAALSSRNYTTTQVKPLLETQMKYTFLPQTVPAYAATEQFNELRKKHPDYALQGGDAQPDRTRATARRDWEADIVNIFRQTSTTPEMIGERDTPTGRSLYLARPIQVKSEACLDCHSTVEAAPKTMVDLYGPANGFGWKMDEVIGAQIVSVPMAVPIARANETFTDVHGLARRRVRRDLRAAQRDALHDGDPARDAPRGHRRPGEPRATWTPASSRRAASDEIGVLTEAMGRMKASLVQAMKMLEG